MGFLPPGSYRKMLVHQVDHLAQLDVEPPVVAGERLDGRLDAFDVAAVIGAPDVDHVLKPAVYLV